MTKTAYRPQTNGQVARYNNKIVTRLRHNIIGYQQYWNIFLQPFTYSYNTQVQGSTNRSPYSLVLMLLPLGPSLLRADSERLLPPQPEASQQQIRAIAQARTLALRDETGVHLGKSQARCTYNHDRIRETPTFHTGENVFLDKPPLLKVSDSQAETLAQKPYDKL